MELRLLSVHDPVLLMGWIRATTNEALEVFEVQRALYDTIAADEGWAEIGQALSGGMFVDMQRMFIEPQAREAAE